MVTDIVEEEVITAPETPHQPDLSAKTLDFLGKGLAKSDEWGGGRPSTKEGQAFVLEYMTKYGEPPSPQQVADYKSGLGPGYNLTFLPTSTPGSTGFRDWNQYLEAQRQQESYGPMMGNGFGLNVPRGGLVITENGIPQFRTFNPGKYAAELKSGQYINPPGGLERLDPAGTFREGAVEGITEGAPGTSYREPYKEYQGATMEEALANFGPIETYKARLEDYLRAAYDKDAPSIEELIAKYNQQVENLGKYPKRGAGGEEVGAFTEEELISQKDALDRALEASLEGLMTEDKLASIVSEATELINKGIAPEGLPLYADMQNLQGVQQEHGPGGEVLTVPGEYEAKWPEGPAVMALYNKGAEISKQRYEQENPKAPLYKGKVEQERDVRTGTEERDYINMVQNMDLAGDVESYMIKRYWEYWDQWMRTGPQVPFMQWVQSAFRGEG